MDQKRNIISETKRENIISKGSKNILLGPGGPSIVTWTWSSYNLFFAGMGENLYKDEKIFKNLNSLQNQSGKIF